ncbi:DUF58 domain-containing protein [Cellulomonas sp. ATA003]|uniref:DUF58 domain-containing protein n=1 Tax=Cellulomonas sp. ATA003 TaxID=3073064 RepID=UPI002872D150|nr:DUF58 domain-containing protein [Cellulomonas sp. ATA003]WNB85811.1 DUF58 domain-containing protein [Cellulomonas sp. ATA003]
MTDDEVMGGAAVRGAWRTGPATAWTARAGVLLVVVGLLTGRPDVALLGVLAALVAARGRGEVPVDVTAQVEHVPEPGAAPGTLRGALRLAAPAGTDAVRVRVHRPGHRAVDALVAVDREREIAVRAASVRTGRLPLLGVQAQALASGGDRTAPTLTVPPRDVVVLPRGRDLGGLPLPPRLRGSTGQHRSRRPGDGGDLRDVHPLGPGDAPRRVDWRVTARRSPGLEQLYVRRTLALAEATATLVVDSRDDLGPDPATWSGERPVRPDDSTSLDLARQAATSVAEGHLVLGDRVGMEDLGVRRRALRVGTGRRQLNRLMHGLALLRPEGRPAARLRPPQVPAGSLVYLFSTFLDDEPVQLARTWQGTGHRVVAVDVLPPPRPTADVRLRLALRMVLLDRTDRLAAVRGAGIDVVRWADDDAATHLDEIARRSLRAPQHAGSRRSA